MANLSFDEGAHLLRRAGFGGTSDEIDDLVSRGREGAVDFLLNYTQIDNSEMNNLLPQSFDFLVPPTEQKEISNGEIRRWWFTRLAYTKRPFEEKMTLFWHNHFATSSSKVQDFLMYNQNLTLRQHALDRFDDLLMAVAKDPAMLVWLDGITNVLGSPNENFGRELQELFTMGINDVVTGEPNYTEQDVKEIARAFTGWNFQRRAAIHIPDQRQPARQHCEDHLRPDVELFRRRRHPDNQREACYGQVSGVETVQLLRLSADEQQRRQEDHR